MRMARSIAPGMVHHVISRFVDRDWFIRDDTERERYRMLLARAFGESDWRCLAYAVMSNHIHVAVVAGESPLESWAKRVNSPFSQWMNRRHGRLGPLFADRPAAYAFPPEREGELIAYIHNNPVRARVVALARDSSWTSHNAYRASVSSSSWLSVAEGLSRAGFKDHPEAFDDWVNLTVDANIASAPLAAIRTTARRRGSVELGTPTNGDRCEVPIVARPGTIVRISVESIITAIANVSGVPENRIASRTAARDASHARRGVVKLARSFGIVSADIGRALGISATSVSRHWTHRTTKEELGVISRARNLLGKRGQS